MFLYPKKEMFNNLTVGDDYTGKCPCCDKQMDISKITNANKLIPGHVDACNRCGGVFEVVRIDHVPVVWFRKKEDNETS